MTPAALGSEAAGSLWRDGSFVRLSLGQFVSAIGDRLSGIAVAVWIVTQREDGAIALGAAFAIRTAASSLFLIVGGVFADRLSPRAQVIGSQLVLGTLIGTLAVLPREAPLAVLLLVFGTAGAVDAFLAPASQMLVVEVAGPARLQAANSLWTLATRSAGLLGPALGGILVAQLGITTTLVLDAASFGVAALAVLTVRGTGSTGPRTSGSPRRILTEAAEGLRLVGRTGWLRAVLLSDLAQTFLGVAPWFVLLPIALLPRGTAGYALTLTAFAAGGLLGAIVPLRWKPGAIGHAALLSQALFALPLAALALDLPLGLVIGAAFVGGFGADLGSVLFITGLQRGVPGSLLGRVTALSSLGSIALLPAGFALAGLIATSIGPAPILTVGVTVILVATAAALRTPGVPRMADPASSKP